MTLCFRDFLLYELNETNFEGSNIERKRAIKMHIEDIEDQIVRGGYFGQLKQQIFLQDTKKEQMENIVNKDKTEENEYVCVKTFYMSKECKQMEKTYEQIWKQAMENGQVNKKDFEKFGSYTLLHLAISDKNRQGCYGFLNFSYCSKVAVYIPKGFNAPLYSDLPPDWKVYKQPYKNARPSMYEIRLSGSESGLKNKQKQTINISKRCFQLMERYKDLKSILFGATDMNQPFFVKANGKPLPKLQNYKNSLLNIFGQVVGVPNFTLKNLRYAMESRVQESVELKKHSKEINSHSVKVGSQYYDKMEHLRRTLVNNALQHEEEGTFDESYNCENTIEREKIEKIEQDKILEEAKAYLAREKDIIHKDFSPHRILDSEIEFLKSYNIVESEKKAWMDCFYKLVDSPDTPQRGELRRIEEKIFQLLKMEIARGGWHGTKSQNDAADRKIR